MKRLLVLGAGTAGTMVANRLRRRLPRDEWRITAVDESDQHFYQPGYLFIPFGTYAADDVVRPRRRSLRAGVDLVHGAIDRVDADADTVVLTDGRDLEGRLAAVGAAPERAQPSPAAPQRAGRGGVHDTERRRLTRYRNTLDDLAHSLKTPLAAMRALLAESREDGTPGPEEAFGRELDRMDQRVSYQLRRARAGGATGLGVEPVAIEPVVHDLVATLDKVYRDKGVSCELDIAPRAVFRGDAGDLSEILGNLLDNAYKYCRRRVLVTVVAFADGVTIEVGDDGQGVSEVIAAKLFERGTRADESVPGQGIGLAVVRETVELYQGTLTVGRSALGGAEIRVSLGRAGA